MIGLLLLLALSGCDTNGEGVAGRCENLRSAGELSYGMAYCAGDFCSAYEDAEGNLKTVKTREQCEAIDVVVRGNIEEHGQDGEGDCKWVEEGQPRCVPNK